MFVAFSGTARSDSVDIRNNFRTAIQESISSPADSETNLVISGNEAYHPSNGYQS